jgi:hypothetical protein
VIELRYGLKGENPRTCEEIGREYNITPQTIKMFAKGALRQLEEASVSEEDLLFLAEWRSVFPEEKAAEKGRCWFFRRGRSRSREESQCELLIEAPQAHLDRAVRPEAATRFQPTCAAGSAPRAQ